VNGSFPGELLTDWEVKLKWKQEQGKRTNKKNRRKNGEPDDNEDQENDRETAVIPSPSVWNFSEISVSSLDQDGIRNHSASAALRSLSFKKKSSVQDVMIFIACVFPLRVSGQEFDD